MKLLNLCLLAWWHLLSASVCVDLNQVRNLVFQSNKYTVPGRTASVPQLTCVEGCKWKVNTVQCTNIGRNTGANGDPIWRCSSQDLPYFLKITTADVICEGCRNRDDPLVLRGSCALEYTISEHFDLASREGFEVIALFLFIALCVCIVLSCASRERETTATRTQSPHREGYHDHSDDGVVHVSSQVVSSVPIAIPVPRYPPKRTQPNLRVTPAPKTVPVTTVRREEPLESVVAVTSRRQEPPEPSRSVVSVTSRRQEPLTSVAPEPSGSVVAVTSRREEPPETVASGSLAAEPSKSVVAATSRREEPPVTDARKDTRVPVTQEFVAVTRRRG